MPKELEEAAYVDGCGRLYTFGKIMLPDALPMLTSCFLFSFVWQWTDTLYTTLFLTNFRIMPLAIGQLTAAFYKYWGQINATGGGGSGLIQNPPLAYVQAILSTGTLLVVVPLILLYLIAQKAFVESLSQTGIKM
jgi:multiple sugar transport system permease protein